MRAGAAVVEDALGERLVRAGAGADVLPEELAVLRVGAKVGGRVGQGRESRDIFRAKVREPGKKTRDLALVRGARSARVPCSTGTWGTW